MSGSARTEARRRHPSLSFRTDAGGLRRRVAGVLEAVGTVHPVVAASVLEARGRSGLDADEFARTAGVDRAVLDAAEGGELAREQLPGVLRRLVPAPDVREGHGGR